MQSIKIAPFETGLVTTLEPWQVPPDGFVRAENVHVHHNYIEKRSGFNKFGQLQTLNNSQNITGITQANPGVVTVGSTAAYSNGNTVFISGVTGMTEVNNQFYVVANKTATTFELQGVDTSAFTAYTGPSGAVQLVTTPGDRVMGIYRYIQATGSQETIAFDTKKTYRFDAALKQFNAVDAADVMASGDEDYVWAVNWDSSNIVNRLYFTNGLAYNGTTNGIRYYDSTSTTSTTLFTPDLDSGMTRKLYGAKLLFVLQQRLLCLHTFEFDGAATTTHHQRARWCAAQSPSNWDDLTAGGGGFVDAPTGDIIISARAIQNQIIVLMTNSVWTIRPVSDPALPFKWEKINDFRAVNGKMASIGYDRYAASLGTRGIIATDGVESKRVDEKIDKFTSEEIAADQFGKVFCERDYDEARWWTLYCDGEDDTTENNAALIYDDDSNAWTTYDISMNCLGYGNLTEDFALEDFTAANELDFTLGEIDESKTLQSYYWLDNSEILLGGDTAGVIYKMDFGNNDNGTDVDMDIITASWNPVLEQNKECRMPYVDFYVDTNLDALLKIEFYKDDNVVPYTSQLIDMLPEIGYIVSVNQIDQTNPCAVNVPQHGLTTGNIVYIYGVLGMEEVNGGPYTVTVVDVNNITLDDVDATAFTAFTSSGALYKRPYYRTKTWKRAYAGGVGNQHSMRITQEGKRVQFRILDYKPMFKPTGKRLID